MIRNVDRLGRICIPSEMRKALEWTEDTPLLITLSNQGVVITKHSSTCSLCGNDQLLVELTPTAKVCMNCVVKIKSI